MEQPPSQKIIISKLDKLTDMMKCLQENPGIFIMKLGAEWCGPCKRIEGLVKSCMDQAPANVQCAIIDVDDSIEIYSFLKNRRTINGIPAILAYYKGNLNYIPDDMVIGSDQNQVIAFFQRCYKEAAQKLV
jgi:thioredoxin-like negative regulator of GroEL